MIPLADSVLDGEISEPTPEDFANLIRACALSGAALDPTTQLEVVMNAVSDIQASMRWLKPISRTLERRSQMLIARKHSHENNALPVSRLPEEILRIIFEYDAETEDTWSSFEDSGWRRRLGSVCRRWRTVVFQHSTLWAKDLFALDNDKAIDILPLTKNSLLNMDLLYPRKVNWKDPDHALTRSIPRAWRLSLPIGYIDDLEDLMEYILSATPLPHLRTLRLCCDANDEVTPTRHRTIADHPNLSFLHLRNLYMRPPLQSALTTLEIEFEWDEDEPWATERPSLGAILEALSQSKATLQHLRLHNSFIRTNGVPGIAQRISLPRLLSLDLVHEADLSAKLMDFLWVPSLETASILWCRGVHVENGVRTYTSMLHAWRMPLPDTTDGSLRMTLSDYALRDIRARPQLFEFALEEMNRSSTGAPRLCRSEMTNVRWNMGQYVFTREVL
ncbi:unnamed protein product [Peniophora sp. CBMAI 1063]|nr:unnamed protein product [Peniophora sp. CBMAI 1063]